MSATSSLSLNYILNAFISHYCFTDVVFSVSCSERFASAPHFKRLCSVLCRCIAVLNKGQVLTDYYRLMNRHGGYVWLQTCATIICNAKNVDEQNIIAINYVLRYAQANQIVTSSLFRPAYT